MKQTIVALVVVGLSGCAGNQAVNSIIADCSNGKGGLSPSCAKNHKNYDQLPQDEKRAISYASVLEEQKAAGKLSPAQAEFLMQEYTAKINNQAAAVSAAQSQASSNAMMMTGAAMMVAGQRQPAVIYPAPQQNYPRTTSCMGGYRSVTCSHF